MGKNRNHYSFFLYFVFIIFVLLGCRPVRVQILSVIRFILIHLLKGISVQKVASCFIMTV